MIIAFANQKGGVAKTTTCLNLGAGLAMRGYSTLLIDSDPQASLSCYLGAEAGKPTLGDWLMDRTPFDQELAIAGRAFDTGIGVLGNSRLEVRNAGFRRFTASVGVDDSAVDKARVVTFEVYGDGRRLARSKPAKWGQAPQDLDVDVSGVKLIELVARTSGQGNADPVTWGDAALRR